MMISELTHNNNVTVSSNVSHIYLPPNPSVIFTNEWIPLANDAGCDQNKIVIHRSRMLIIDVTSFVIDVTAKVLQLLSNL